MLLSVMVSLLAVLVSGDNLLDDLHIDQESEEELVEAQLPFCGQDEENPSCNAFNSDDIVQCVGDEVLLTPCYCLAEVNTNSSSYALFHCQFTCFRNTYLHGSNMSTIVKAQCNGFKRSGNYCGKCANNTTYPAYSYSLRCIECDEPSWIKYILVAYVPLTVFIGILFVFRITVNTVPILGFILVAQISTFSFQVRLAVGMIEAKLSNIYQAIGIHILSCAYGIWNLDFFRTFLPGICVSRSSSILSIMCLDYIIAFYPLLLILTVYVFVEGYSRGYRVFFWWKPFHWCLSRLKNEIISVNIPLMDVFGTFFSLSYAKILSTSFDILSVTPVWNSHGTLRYVPYYSPDDPIWKPCFIIGLVMFICFNLLPIFLLFVYSLRSVPNQTDTVRFYDPLLNALLIPYKDGQNGTRNLRWFSVVYLIVRILLVVALQVQPTIFFQLVAAIVCLILGMLVAIIRPYKSDMYNTVDTVLILSLAVGYTSILSYYYVDFISHDSTVISNLFGAMSCSMSLLYFMLIMARYFIIVRKYPQRMMKNILKCLSKTKVCVKVLIRNKGIKSLRIEREESIGSRGATYVAIESDTVRVTNAALYP